MPGDPQITNRATLAGGRVVYWIDKLDFYGWLYRRGVLTHTEYEAVGGDLARVPSQEDLLVRAVDMP